MNCFRNDHIWLSVENSVLFLAPLCRRFLEFRLVNFGTQDSNLKLAIHTRFIYICAVFFAYVFYTLADVPQDVVEAQSRSNHVVSVLIRGVEDSVDDGVNDKKSTPTSTMALKSLPENAIAPVFDFDNPHLLRVNDKHVQGVRHLLFCFFFFANSYEQLNIVRIAERNEHAEAQTAAADILSQNITSAAQTIRARAMLRQKGPPKTTIDNGAFSFPILFFTDLWILDKISARAFAQIWLVGRIAELLCRDWPAWPSCLEQLISLHCKILP
jgi:hypothetical protein